MIVSRNARKSGARDPIRIGFPTVPVPPAMESHWTMIHAIARQESQFDREALSRVGRARADAADDRDRARASGQARPAVESGAG